MFRVNKTNTSKLSLLSFLNTSVSMDTCTKIVKIGSKATKRAI